jgi:IclR family acetate operon transcriptional repressor
MKLKLNYFHYVHRINEREMAKNSKDKLRSYNRGIQSVARALNILEVLSKAQGEGKVGEMQLGEIANATDLNVSTCHHLILTLMNRGYVAQHKRGQAYFIGTKIHELSSNRARQFSLADSAMPELRQLNMVTGENAHLAVLQGDDLVVLAQFESPQVVRVNLEAVNLTNSSHATAIGKSILAWLPDVEIERIVNQKGLVKYTPATIVDFDHLKENLRLVRRFGYAIDQEEFVVGVASVGTVLRDQAGTVLGSVSCTLPASRADTVHFDAVKNAVLQCSVDLSRKLSCQI